MSSQKGKQSWQMGRVVRTFSGHVRRISSLAVSDDSKYLYTGSVDGTARRWDTSTGSCLMVYENNGYGITCICHRGKFLWTGGASFNSTMRKWDVKFGKQLHEFKGHKSGIVELKTDDDCLYSGSWDGTVKSWQIGDSSEVLVYQGHKESSQIKAFSVSECHVASGSTDKTCRVYDKKTAECVAVVTLDFTVCAVLLLDDHLFLGNKASVGFKYVAKTGELVTQLEEPEDTHTDLGTDHPASGFKQFAVSKVGGCVAVADRSAAHLWNAQTGKFIHTLYEAENTDVNALALVAAPDQDPGRGYCFSGLDDNTVHMYCIEEPVGDTGTSGSTPTPTAPVIATSKATPTSLKEGNAPEASKCCVVS